MLDTFIAAVRFVEGAPAKPWWAYTAERKRTLAARAKAPANMPTTRRAHAAARRRQTRSPRCPISDGAGALAGRQAR